MRPKTIANILVAMGLGGALSVASAVSAANDGAERGPMKHFEHMDLNGDGSVTLEEMTTHRNEMFTKSDADGDGLLSPAELTAAMEERAAKRIERRVARMIERHDTNGDGLLSAEEADHEEEMTRMFSRMDADGDGAITAAEIKERGYRGHRHGHGHGDGMGAGGAEKSAE